MRINPVKDIKDDALKWSMHYGATPTMFKLAESLRERMTEAESKLWNAIKKNDWKLNFRRQHPIAIYIADFYCHKIKLVIELDGGYHENQQIKISDKAREDEILKFGIAVLRFKNEEVINDIEKVFKKISSSIAARQDVKNIIEGKDSNKSETFVTVVPRNIEDPQTSPSGAGGKMGYQQASTSETDNIEKTKNSISETGNTGKTPASSLEVRKTAQTESSNTLAGLQKVTPLPQLFVVKIGGNVIDDEIALESFLRDFASINAKKLLVHGGGKIATKIGEQLGIESKYINGRRITDANTIDLVTMVYGGLVNKKIVAKLQAVRCNAIGVTGADANIIQATKRPVKGIDYGFAGDITNNSVSFQNLDVLISNSLTPVVAPLTHDGEGQILNTNADTIASALAVSLSKTYKVRLIYCFEKKGVLEDVNDGKSVIGLITKEKYQQLIEEKKLFEGILPKIDNAFASIDNGVAEVLIGHADYLLQNVTENTCGTIIK